MIMREFYVVDFDYVISGGKVGGPWDLQKNQLINTVYYQSLGPRAECKEVSHGNNTNPEKVDEFLVRPLAASLLLSIKVL
jgi:hypothetical protein